MTTPAWSWSDVRGMPGRRPHSVTAGKHDAAIGALLTSGMSIVQLAQRLDCSQSTLRSRISNLQRQGKPMPRPRGTLNDSHGHVRPRPDGVKARCGGPGLCLRCGRELAALSTRELTEYHDRIVRQVRSLIPDRDPPEAA